MNREKISLEKEKETLLIPLYCRAMETRKKNPVITDTKAVEILNQIDYDFSQLKVPGGTYITTCMRARKFDTCVASFLNNKPESCVISLGCGLDSRFDRVDNDRVEWYDLDFPEVINVRKLFYTETDRYHFIPSPVMDVTWVDTVSKKNIPVLIIAEGLMMYLKEDEVKSLVLTLQRSFPGCNLIFDCFSMVTAKRISRHPSLKKTKARIHWGLDDAHDIEKWNTGITLIEEWFFTQSEDIKKMKCGYRFMFKIAGCFAVARKAHRLLMYQL